MQVTDTNVVWSITSHLCWACVSEVTTSWKGISSYLSPFLSTCNW